MSEAKRFFIDGEIGETAELTDGEFVHAATVMRTRIGDAVILCNGDGNDYRGTVTAIEKKRMMIEINQKVVNSCEPRKSVTLYQALCKGERMEWIAQKATELGVVGIVPFVSAFTTVKADTNKAQRMEKIVIEAAKQCGRACVPKVQSVTTFENVLIDFAKYDTIIFAYEHAEDGALSSALSGAQQRIAVVVGSEGGFSEAEVTAAIQSGAKVVTMGPRILRAETAAVALIAAVMSGLGEWSR